MDQRGIEPLTFRMQTERSTIELLAPALSAKDTAQRPQEVLQNAEHVHRRKEDEDDTGEFVHEVRAAQATREIPFGPIHFAKDVHERVSLPNQEYPDRDPD